MRRGLYGFIDWILTLSEVIGERNEFRAIHHILISIGRYLYSVRNFALDSTTFVLRLGLVLQLNIQLLRGFHCETINEVTILVTN